MFQKIRIFLWIIIVTILVISSSFFAFQMGKQQGINQAYNELSTQKIILPEAEEYIPE